MEIRIDGPGAIPEYATDGSAGADLRASADAVLEPGARAAVPISATWWRGRARL